MDKTSKIYICDFNDSFTYNIFSLFKNYNDKLEIEVITHSRLLSFFQCLAASTEKAIIVYGPGPGHPDDYEHLYSSIRPLLSKNNYFHVGICLGHQLIWKLLGHSIEHSTNPMHGNVEVLDINGPFAKILKIESKVEVQRYNSLAVKIDSKLASKLELSGWNFYFKEGELFMAYNTEARVLSYQFHPESIGTSCPNYFLRPLSEFLL